MTEGLKVIALISGGKDSLFSILHCLVNGHEIVALANLYPHPREEKETDQHSEIDDIESHMYQTIGHSILPLYASALNIPIYRQPIQGTAINQSKSYHPPQASSPPTATQQQGSPAQTPTPEDEEETESLVPLLQHIKTRHPDANALSTGAILSTYQRTRIESVALRLALVPLAYLWQYPLLPPYTQSSLLHDMRAVGLDARIVKVASGGLDAGMLWENVADESVIRRLARSMQRFAGGYGAQIGAVLGEGGEFETLAVDGPRVLFARRLVVGDKEREVVRGEGGTAFVRVLGAAVVEKEDQEGDLEDLDGQGLRQLRRPELWDEEFVELLRSLESGDLDDGQEDSIPALADVQPARRIHSPTNTSPNSAQTVFPFTLTTTPSVIYLSNITAHTSRGSSVTTGATQVSEILAAVQEHLAGQNLAPADISFTTILLRSMALFVSFNQAYASLFSLPNPPARVTIAVGDTLPPGTDIMISLVIERVPRDVELGAGHNERMALHVQSRSYWAPANIGPYSQAVAVPLTRYRDKSEDSSALASEAEHGIWDDCAALVKLVHVAGQIPLVPASMSVLESTGFNEQAALSLQHLWRVGRAMGVGWWGGGAVAFVTADSAEAAKQRAIVVGRIWRGIHKRHEDSAVSKAEESDEDEVDIGNAALYRPWDLNAQEFGAGSAGDADKICRALLPDWTFVDDGIHQNGVEPGSDSPPCFIVEVTELPRSAQVEWWSFGFAKMKSRSRVGLKDDGMTCQVEGLQVSWRACTRYEELYDCLQCTMMDRDASMSTSFWEVFSPHILDEDMLVSAQAMVILCKSVWDAAGKELFAAVRCRRYVTSR